MDIKEEFEKQSPSPLSTALLHSLEQQHIPNHERKITVNPMVSKMAEWYEKLRNAMEYREDEVILRAAIERILKRRLLLGGNAKTTAEPLVRELVWARYLPDNGVPLSNVDKVEKSIELFLTLRLRIIAQHKISETTINEWFYHLMSSDIEHILRPAVEKESINNFMYQILKEQVTILDDTEETKNAQVYSATRRAFARDDIAFLRYNLFKLYFGPLTEHSIEKIATNFMEGYEEIKMQMKYPRKDRIFNYIKKRTAVFFILEDILGKDHKENKRIVENLDVLKEKVYAACEVRYQSIKEKVRRAIIRSVFFLLFTKVIFAFAVEGTYDRVVYGEILWVPLAINTISPALLMIIVSLFIKVPDESNTKRIFSYIQEVLYSDSPRVGSELVVKKKPGRQKPIATVFTILWLFAFLLSFGSITYVLDLLHFSIASKFVFLFFLTIVSFLAYRISNTAKLYTVEEKQSVITPIVDFLFLPIIRVGRHLTSNISRLNVLLFIFDFIIETPFKLIFAFFEQWFHFLHSKREDLEESS